MNNSLLCILCDKKAASNELTDGALKIICPKCGTYLCESHFLDECKEDEGFSRNRHKLSGFFFELNDAFGAKDQAELWRELSKYIVDSDFQGKIIKNNPSIPGDFEIDAKILKFLTYMKRKTAYPGQIVDGQDLFEHIDQLFYTPDEVSVGFLWEIIEDKGLVDGIKMQKTMNGTPHFNYSAPMLTERALRLLSGLETDSTQIFLALQFNGETHTIIDDTFKQQILEQTGFKLKTVADIEHNNLIDDQIIAEINRSIAIVADFSEGNHGAYYEAGYAHGQGKELIFLCKDTVMDSLERQNKPHFDVNHRSFVVWKSPADLLEKLARRINATLSVRN